jgi:LytR cell envelope-related transcriptional attenuator
VELPALRRAATGALLIAIAAIGILFWRRHDGGGRPGASRQSVVPAGVRIKVEVLNASGVRGLARRATFALRDAGFDVVRYANDTGRLDSTVVLDRSGNADWARLVVRALGSGRVEARPDSSRYLDVTVLLGTDWRPPSQPFHP